MTSGSFDAVQKVPLGTLTPGSTGLPGAGLDPRCGCGVGEAMTAAARAKAVMKGVERMMIEGAGWKWKVEEGDGCVMRLPESFGLCEESW